MKKKFVLTLALVLLVAVTLTAAPVELTGSFKAGYKFTFDDPIKVGGAYNDGTNQVVMGALSASSDFWKVAVSTTGTQFFGKTTGNITLYLDKAFKEEGVDMGDVTLSVVLGNKDNMDGLVVYGDPDGSYDMNAGKLRMIGTLSTGVTLGYASLGSLYVAFDPTTGNENVLVSAKIAPVDGVSATFGWAKTTGASADGAINGSVKVDVAKLADLDMDLAVSAVALYDLDNSKNLELLAAVETEIEGIGLWVEYTNLAKAHGIGVGASYDVNEKLGLSASFRMGDLENIDTTYAASAGVTYGLFGGATYALGLGYGYDATAAKGLFTVTPSVKVTF